MIHHLRKGHHNHDFLQDCGNACEERAVTLSNCQNFLSYLLEESCHFTSILSSFMAVGKHVNWCPPLQSALPNSCHLLWMLDIIWPGDARMLYMFLC